MGEVIKLCKAHQSFKNTKCKYDKELPQFYLSMVDLKVREFMGKWFHVVTNWPTESCIAGIALGNGAIE